MTIIELVEKVAAGELSYEQAMDELDSLSISAEQWADAEMALRQAMP